MIDVPRDETQMQLVSDIVVGTIVHTVRVGSPRSSKWRPQWHTQLWETMVDVENVLKGAVKTGKLPIYYYVFADSYSGGPLLGSWRPGERRLFFLQRDGSVVRMVCDNYRHCTLPVFTGMHQRYKNLHSNLYEEIPHFLVQRGDRCSDADVVRALDQLANLPFAGPPSSPYTLREVKETLIRENRPVRREACNLLKEYGQDYRKNPFKDNAQLYKLYHDPLEDDWRQACKVAWTSE